MTFFEGVSSWLVEHGAMLCLGSTVVLAIGALVVRLCRAPVHRRRLGMLTALATLGYLLCATAPLPRLLPVHDTIAPASAAAFVAPPATASPAAAPAAAAPPAERAAAIERALAQLDGEVLRAAAASPLPAHTAPLAPAGSPWSWPLVIPLVYLAGAVFVLLRLVAGSIRLGVLLASCAPVPAASVRGIELPARVRLLATARDVRPFCTGVLRPAIVLPCSLLSPARRAEAIAVIRHEAAHLRNGDPLAQSLLALLAIPLFWHPLLWWLARDVRFPSELLADDAAAGTGRTDYARALLQLAERAQPELRAAGTVAVFHRPSEFFRRIQMLLQREGSLSTSISRRQRALHAVAAAGLVAASAGLFGVGVPAQEPKPSTSREAALRDTIATLRADLGTLRAELDALRAQRSVQFGYTIEGEGATPPPTPASRNHNVLYGTRGELPPTPTEVKTLYRGDQSMRGFEVTPAPALDPVSMPAPRPGSNGQSPVQPLPQPGAGNVDGQPFGYTPAPPPAPLPAHPSASTYSASRADTPTPNVPPPTPYPAPGMAPPGSPPADSFFGSEAFPAVDPASPFGASPHGGADSRTAAATADLASRYIDLVGEIELETANADEQKRLATAGLAPQHETRRAEVNLRTLKRKLGVVDKLLNGEIAATEAEIGWLADEQGRVAPQERGRLAAQLQRATMRLEAMRSVR